MDNYVRKLQEPNRLLNILQMDQKGLPVDLEFNTRSPFTRWIMDKPIPTHFYMPQMDLYDGTSDLFYHLESYRTFMTI